MAVFRIAPARLLLFGYLSYIAIGWALLALPLAQRGGVGAVDTLFISASAVSTTGLVTVDPGTGFTGFGQAVILALIQIGGLGYMTIGSFVVLSLQHRLSGMRAHTLRAAFSLPERIRPAAFLWAVILFTLACESLGAAALYPFLVAAGDPAPLWSAVFHSVSAFCTAGFSLNATSFEAYAANAPVLLILSGLSLLGAVGFLVVLDIWTTLTGRTRHLGFTTKVILSVTFWFLALGTLVLFVVEPALAAMPADERLLSAFFQAMTALTTVGFDSVPIGNLSPAILLVIVLLMLFGASPAGTGGGLKTTTFAALVGLVRSTLKGRRTVRFMKRTVPPERLQAAAAGLAYYGVLLFVAMFLLLLTEPGARFEALLFEAVSAMGTVGLSTGLTGSLTDLGKLVIVVLMVAGRVGILTFGVALARRDESPEEESDNELVV